MRTLRLSAIKDGRVLDQWMYAIVRDEAVRATRRYGFTTIDPTMRG